MDDALLGVVLDRLDQTSPTEATSNVVLAALEGDAQLAEVLGGATRARPAARRSAAAGGEPAGAYLSAIAAAGFRGIGPAATLPVAPGPGLTVVAGRNGSGKSSFAEALEVALTGGLRRWMSLPMVWKEGWRNLHEGTAPFVRAEWVIEGAGPLTVERTWDAKAGLDRGRASVRTAGGPPGAVDQLGWTVALSEFRPFLSHAELEAFFGRPSDFYDLLASVLGLDDLADAAKRLADARLERDKAMAAAKDALDPIMDRLRALDDERAVRVRAALGGRSWDLETATSAALAVGERSGDGVLPWLAQVSSLTVATGDQVQAAAAGLRGAADGLEAVAGTESERSRELARLLMAAVAHHRAHGDGDCPVCGRTGALDEDWHRQTEAEIDRLQRQAADAEAARDAAHQARAAAVQLIAPPPTELRSSPDPDVDPSSAARAWEAWATLPSDADAGARATGLRGPTDPQSTVLLTPLRGDRLHRSHLRGVHEALAPLRASTSLTKVIRILL